MREETCAYLLYSPLKTDERQRKLGMRCERCHVPVVSESPPIHIRRRNTRKRKRFVRFLENFWAATYPRRPPIGCSRVANGYPEVCLFSNRLRQTLRQGESASIEELAQTAQSRLSAANLEEARPLRRHCKQTRNKSGDQPDLGSPLCIRSEAEHRLEDQ